MGLESVCREVVRTFVSRVLSGNCQGLSCFRTHSMHAFLRSVLHTVWLVMITLFLVLDGGRFYMMRIDFHLSGTMHCTYNSTIS